MESLYPVVTAASAAQARSLQLTLHPAHSAAPAHSAVQLQHKDIVQEPGGAPPQETPTPPAVQRRALRSCTAYDAHCTRPTALRSSCARTLRRTRGASTTPCEHSGVALS